MGIIVNYYGYLGCFGKVDFDRGRHNWPCKGTHWTPWSGSSKADKKDAMKLGIGANVSEPAAVTPRPGKTLVPRMKFVGAGGPNVTAGTNGSVSTVTVVPTT